MPANKGTLASILQRGLKQEHQDQSQLLKEFQELSRKLEAGEKLTAPQMKRIGDLGRTLGVDRPSLLAPKAPPQVLTPPQMRAPPAPAPHPLLSELLGKGKVALGQARQTGKGLLSWMGEQGRKAQQTLAGLLPKTEEAEELAPEDYETVEEGKEELKQNKTRRRLRKLRHQAGQAARRMGRGAKRVGKAVAKPLGAGLDKTADWLSRGAPTQPEAEGEEPLDVAIPSFLERSKYNLGRVPGAVAKGRFGDIRQMLGGKGLRLGGSTAALGGAMLWDALEGGHQGRGWLGYGGKLAGTVAGESFGGPIGGIVGGVFGEKIGRMLEGFRHRPSFFKEMGAATTEALAGAQKQHAGEIVEAQGRMVGHVGKAFGIPFSDKMGKMVEWVGKATEALRKWNEGIMQGNFQFAQFSAAMSAVQTRHEVRQMQMDMTMGNYLAESAEKQAKAADEWEKQNKGIEAGWKGMWNELTAGFTQFFVDLRKKWGLDFGMNKGALGAPGTLRGDPLLQNLFGLPNAPFFRAWDDDWGKPDRFQRGRFR